MSTRNSINIKWFFDKNTWVHRKIINREVRSASFKKAGMKAKRSLGGPAKCHKCLRFFFFGNRWCTFLTAQMKVACLLLSTWHWSTNEMVSPRQLKQYSRCIDTGTFCTATAVCYVCLPLLRVVTIVPSFSLRITSPPAMLRTLRNTLSLYRVIRWNASVKSETTEMCPSSMLLFSGSLARFLLYVGSWSFELDMQVEIMDWSIYSLWTSRGAAGFQIFKKYTNARFQMIWLSLSLHISLARSAPFQEQADMLES